MVKVQRNPVVLVHGWNSHPGVWKPLVLKLQKEAILTWNFGHDTAKNTGSQKICLSLQEYISSMREKTGYYGDVDVVCHSMGNAVVRYLLEVIDGKERKEKVRSLIMLGPPNRGSTMAELFNHPDKGPDVIRNLSGIFVPPGFNPLLDPIIQELRPQSSFFDELKKAGIRKDIRYRVIMTSNKTRDRAFFPIFDGTTWEIQNNGDWLRTYSGDGVIPHSESMLPGAEHVDLPNNQVSLVSSPEKYCHIHLPRNPEVMEQVVAFLVQ
jgi:triacylglycerol lipase